MAPRSSTGRAGRPAAPLKSEPKRRACDRCRRNKLSCSQLGNPVGPCSRCLGQGVICTTTLRDPKKMPTAGAPAQSLQQLSVPPTDRDPMPPGPPLDAPETINLPNAAWLSTLLGQATPPGEWSWPSLQPNPDVPVSHDDDLFHDSSVPGPLHPAATPSKASPFTDVQMLTNCELVPVPTDNDSRHLLSAQNLNEAFPTSSQSSDRESGELSPLYTRISSSGVAQFGLLLGSTQEEGGDMSRRLQRLRVGLESSQRKFQVSRELGDWAKTGLQWCREPLAHEGDPSFFSDLLCSTSELASIIQEYSRKQGDLTPDTNSSSVAGPAEGEPSLPPQSCQDLVILLDILSAYTQIMATYDILCRRLDTTMHNQPSRGNQDMAAIDVQTLPGLHLAGLVIPPGFLQTQILIQVVIHQFETLERLLALPSELCVSGKRDLYTKGLFGPDLKVSALLEGFLAAGTRCLEGHVTSLRASISKVKALLDTDSYPVK